MNKFSDWVIKTASSVATQQSLMAFVSTIFVIGILMFAGAYNIETLPTNLKPCAVLAVMGVIVGVVGTVGSLIAITLGIATKFLLRIMA